MLQEVARHSLFIALASSTGFPLPNQAQQLAITSSFQLAGKGVRASVGTASEIHTFLPHPHITEASAHLSPTPSHWECWTHHVHSMEMQYKKGRGNEHSGDTGPRGGFPKE